MEGYNPCPDYEKVTPYGANKCNVVVCGKGRNCPYDHDGNQIECKEGKIGVICLTNKGVEANELEKS